MVPIISVIKDSFQEYEPYHSVVFFVHGCNLHCKDCYNYNEISKNENITDNLRVALFKNINDMHQAIVIIGGEPTIWGGNLIEDFRFIKKRYPTLKVKVFTNGMLPDVIRAINKNKLVNAYSVDLKLVEGDVKTILGHKTLTVENYLNRFEKTMRYILAYNLDVEIRTTAFSYIDADKVTKYLKEKFNNIKHIIQQPFSKR